MGMRLRDVPEFEEGLKSIDDLWSAWAVGAYGRQLQDILRGPREQRVNFILLELAKPLAIAMRDIPMDEHWHEALKAAVQELASTDRAYFAVIQAQALFVDDLIDLALSSRGS